jgi:hypothetical protein
LIKYLCLSERERQPRRMIVWNDLDRRVPHVKLHLGEDGGGDVAVDGVLDHGEEVGHPLCPRGRGKGLEDDAQLDKVKGQVDCLEVGLGVKENLGCQSGQGLTDC